MIIALTCISFRNNFSCEKDAKVKLAYDLGALASAKRKSKQSVKEITDIEDNLIYPTIKQTQLSIKYLRLPVSVRKHIFTSLGNKPFDLIKPLKINRLLNDWFRFILNNIGDYFCLNMLINCFS